MELIVNQVHENKQTLILVTHDKSIAAYADKVATIVDGNIVEVRNKAGELIPAVLETELEEANPNVNID